MSITSTTIKRKKTPPQLRGGLPYLGHVLEFGQNLVKFLHRGREQFGEIFSFLLAGKQVTVLTGSEANEAFFKASDDRLSAREAYQFMVPIFGKGIACDVSPELMDEQLAFVFPALREEHRQHRYATIGFGGGRHGCIGEAFAYQQVKMNQTVLLEKFDFQLMQRNYEQNYSTFAIGPKQPCLVRYRRKQK